ncbi:peptidylprolyl isomerase [Euryarchaeota archaeon]|nr:peptidylprolyl isomerase [Euryarchaeota archaeon]
MRVIAPMMILIMVTSTLAGCTSQTDGINEFEEGDINSIVNFIDENQEPLWINDRGNSSHDWKVSLNDEQWLEVKSSRALEYYQFQGEDRWSSTDYYVRSDTGHYVYEGEYSPIFGGNYSICYSAGNNLNDCPYSNSQRSLVEWSIIYRIHNVSGVNYYIGDNLSEEILNPDVNTNISIEISYVPNGMDENSRNTSVINIELYNNDAPNHVDSFLTHIERGNYNSTIFHRIINNFMIQGGDIEGLNGYGGYASNWYGYCDGTAASSSDSCNENSWTLPDEADNGLTHTPGALSMAKTSSPNTGGSQFFIVPSDSSPSHLDGVHTVFGYVTSGLDHIDMISEVETGSNDRPLYDVTIINITIDNLDN